MTGVKSVLRVVIKKKFANYCTLEKTMIFLDIISHLCVFFDDDSCC